jgi:hypothetical protein
VEKLCENTDEAGKAPRRNSMIVRYLILITTLAFLGFSISGFAAKPVCPGDPRCKPDDGDGGSVVYTVALTAGVFRFNAEEASLNSKGHLNSVSGLSLIMNRPQDTTEQALWDAVINTCAGPLVGYPPLTIEQMVVNFDAWAVGKNSDNNIWIDLPSIRLPNHPAEAEKKIQIQLRGVPGTGYLPSEGQAEIFDLDFYVIWVKPIKGGGWDTCFESNDGGDVFPHATLEITRPLPE